MSTKADVSPANWQVLVESAPAIARAVSAAGSPSDWDVELAAFAQFVAAAARTPTDSVLGSATARNRTVHTRSRPTR